MGLITGESKLAPAYRQCRKRQVVVGCFVLTVACEDCSINHKTVVRQTEVCRTFRSGFKGGNMSKIWDEREKALEDEYFRGKEQQLIDKLRQKRADELQRKQ